MILGRSCAGGSDEQAVLLSGAAEGACDAYVDVVEDQEAANFKQAVVSHHQDADTGRVEEGHLGEVEVDDPAPGNLLSLEQLGERFARGKVKLADDPDGGAQWIELDDRQLETGRGGVVQDLSDDDAPWFRIRVTRGLGVRVETTQS